MRFKLKHILVLFFLFAAALANAQASKVVSWKYEIRKTTDHEYDLVFKALISADTHVYSQFIGDGGPIPTSFSFNKNDNYTLVDSVVEKSKPIKVHDKMFDMDLLYFEDSALFVQHIKVVKPVDNITGSLKFMACQKNVCFPPSTLDFLFMIPKK